MNYNVVRRCVLVWLRQRCLPVQKPLEISLVCLHCVYAACNQWAVKQMSARCVAMSAGVQCVCVCAHVINSSLAVYHHSYFACRNNNSGNKSRQLFGLLTLSRESCLWFAVFSVCLSVYAYVCVAFAKLRLLRYKTNLQQQQRMQAGKQGVLFSFLSYSSFSWRTYFLPSHAVGSIDLIVIVYLVRMQSMQATHTHIHADTGKTNVLIAFDWIALKFIYTETRNLFDYWFLTAETEKERVTVEEVKGWQKRAPL